MRRAAMELALQVWPGRLYLSGKHKPIERILQGGEALSNPCTVSRLEADVSDADAEVVRVTAVVKRVKPPVLMREWRAAQKVLLLLLVLLLMLLLVLLLVLLSVFVFLVLLLVLMRSLLQDKHDLTSGGDGATRGEDHSSAHRAVVAAARVKTMRKLRTYDVEAAFYRDVAAALRRESESMLAALPEMLHESEGDAKVTMHMERTMVLTDMKPYFPRLPDLGSDGKGEWTARDGMSVDDSKAALGFLAELHQRFILVATPEPDKVAFDVSERAVHDEPLSPRPDHIASALDWGSPVAPRRDTGDVANGMRDKKARAGREVLDELSMHYTTQRRGRRWTDGIQELCPACVDQDLEMHSSVMLPCVCCLHTWGSYWRLPARSERERGELSSKVAEASRPMAKLWAALQKLAPAVSAKLHGRNAWNSDASEEWVDRRWMTVVHGDFKPDNLMLTDAEGEGVGVVDFQYAGGGYGALDVAYFLCVGVDPELLSNAEPDDDKPHKELQRSEAEKALLLHYHTTTNRVWRERMQQEGKLGHKDELGQPKQLRGKDARRECLPWAVLAMLLDLALLDWARFMCGWGVWGNHAWVAARANLLIRRLDRQVYHNRAAAGSTMREGEEDEADELVVKKAKAALHKDAYQVPPTAVEYATALDQLYNIQEQ